MECRIKHVLSLFSDSDKCIPWYFPPVDPDVRLCSPYESRNFSREMEKMAHDVCKVRIETLTLQRGPSGRRTLFVDIKFNSKFHHSINFLYSAARARI